MCLFHFISFCHLSACHCGSTLFIDQGPPSFALTADNNRTSVSIQVAQLGPPTRWIIAVPCLVHQVHSLWPQPRSGRLAPICLSDGLCLPGRWHDEVVTAKETQHRTTPPNESTEANSRGGIKKSTKSIDFCCCRVCARPLPALCLPIPPSLTSPHPTQLVVCPSIHDQTAATLKNGEPMNAIRK